MRSEYINRVIELHINNSGDVVNEYKACYPHIWSAVDKSNENSTLVFIETCAELDYADGYHSGAVFQEIFDELNKE